jgi:hypothetical protein
MNSYFFDISGHWWLAVLLIAAAAVLTYLTYKRTIPPISRLRRYILISLRFIGLSLLLFALFQPVFVMVSGREDPPEVAVLFDNSISTGENDAKGSRKEAYKLALDNLQLDKLGNKNIKYLFFDSDVKEFEKFDPALIQHNGQQTDISKALQRVSAISDKENIRAVLLVSDGAYNAGNNPLYTTDLLGKPVYTVGIGDSSEQKDISLSSIVTNEMAFIDNPVPVNVNIKISGYESGDLTLTISDNGTKVDEQKFSINPSKQAYSAVFQYNPKTEGVHKLTAKISEMPGEITYKNNTQSEFITVLKNKKRIAVFAGAPSSDLSFITDELRKDKTVEVKEYIQKKGSEFFDEYPSQVDIQNTELFVFIGFPLSSTPDALLTTIKGSLDHGKPILFIASQQTDYNKLKSIQEDLPFTVISSKGEEFLAQPDVRQEALSSPLIRVTGTEKDAELWNLLPPIFKTETFVKAKPESEVVATIKVNNVPIKEPLIMTRSLQNRKSVAIMGYGLYRWKLIGYAAEIAKGRTNTPDLFEQLMQNSFRWLSISQDSKNIRIRTTKKIYPAGENVEFIAQVYDAAFTPVDNATVQIRISGGAQNFDLTLNSSGNGQYQGTYSGLAAGDYAFIGNVTSNGVKLGSDNGRFNIGDIPIEFMDMRMNAQLLSTMASRTGGRFYTPETAGTFITDLKANPGFQSRGMTVRSEIALWNLPYLLGIALACFSIEWFMRKRAGMI